MNRVAITFLGLTGAIVLGVFGVAFFLEADYSDSYFLLSNAKSIATGGGPYDYHRFIVPGILHAPAFWIDAFAWRIPHLLGAYAFAMLAVAGYFLYRRFLSPVSAALGVFLLISTPLLLHYAPTAKEDVFALTFTVATFALYFRDRVWLAGAAAALAVGSRYNLGPIVFGLLLALEWRRRRVLPLFVFPAVLFLLFPLVVYPWIGRSSFLEAVPLFLRELAWQYRENAMVGGKGPGVGLLMLKRLVGSPGLALGVLGLIVAWRKKRREDAPFAVWGILSMLVLLYLTPGKEGRYFFVCLAPIYYFAVRGLEECWASKSKLGYLAVAVFLGIGGYRTGRELDKWRDPFYRRPIARELSATAAAWAVETGGKIIWVGDFYATFPREAVFTLEDDYAYIYHLHKHVVQFHTGRAIGQLAGGEMTRGERWEDGVALPGIDGIVEKGDILIVNPERIPVVTRTLGAEEHPPLVLQRVGGKAKSAVYFDRVRIFQ